VTLLQLNEFNREGDTANLVISCCDLKSNIVLTVIEISRELSDDA